MKGRALRLFRAVTDATKYPKTVTTYGKSVTTYKLTDTSSVIIEHPQITTFEGLLAQMQGQPLVARTALAVTHKHVIPANSRALRVLYETVDPDQVLSDKTHDHIDFALLFRELDNIRDTRAIQMLHAEHIGRLEKYSM